jgi:hypothetical protein
MKRLVLVISMALAIGHAWTQGYAGGGAAMYGAKELNSPYGTNFQNKIGVNFTLLLGKVYIGFGANLAGGRGKEIFPPRDVNWWEYKQRVEVQTLSLGYKFQHDWLSIIPYAGVATSQLIYQDDFSNWPSRTFFYGKYQNHFTYGALLGFTVNKNKNLIYLGGGYLERFKAGVLFKFHEKGQFHIEL